ncbi:MAG: hypothetical protein AAGF12_25760 [Myxococcota bacterium]
MFREVLEKVVDGTHGGVAGLLMGYDGIPVEQYVKDNSEVDVETVGMEYSVILRDIRKAAEMLQAGSAHEVSIKADRLITVIRLINDEYFVAITLTPDGHTGKARYLLRTTAQSLRANLE